MNAIWIAIAALSVLGLLFGVVLGYASRRFAVEDDPVVEKIDDLLPQSQCGQCGYPGCRPYAEAVGLQGEKINRCAPGGEAVMLKIAEMLNVEPQPIDGDVVVPEPVRMLAIIDEANCIGCTKCIQACPVDAIVGATRAMHTVMSDLCTGCNLCVDPCPTQCIELRPVETPVGNGTCRPFPCASFPWNNMLKLFSAFRKDKLWDFHGGIHPPEMKTQSSGTPLRQLPLATRFVIPLKQHIGAEGELCVNVGDSVLRGQPLTRGRGRMLPVHAPTSGNIVAIAPHSTAHPSALPELSVIIEADGEDRWIERDGWSDYRSRDRDALIERIHQFGVAGLGGAGFPTGAKLKSGGDLIETLIINAAECEPYITADDRLMQDCAAQIVEGVRILMHILQPRQVLIGIEDNKPQAISMLRAVLAGSHDIQLRVIPTKYPSGGAKQLTQILTGKQVPHGGRSSDIGVLMQNVGTAYAIKRAIIDGEPLTDRVVTLTGESVSKPGNVWARLGTPVRHLLEHAGFCPSAEQLVIMGGPLMGFTLPWLDVPVVKITNCLLAPSASEMGEQQEEKGCIRCSACADACPADLLPQQLYWFSKGQQHDKATAHNLSDCIECGACAWVCPSNIPLVQYYRQEKADI